MPTRGQLDNTEKLAAQYMACGMSDQEVAAACQMALPLLRRLVKHPLFVQELEVCRRRVFPVLAERLAGRLEALQEPALERMGALLEAESEAVQFQASKDLLNRGPLASRMAESGQGAAPITLDQAALTAILAGALNSGQIDITLAFARLAQAPGPSQPTPMPPLPERSIDLES